MLHDGIDHRRPCLCDVTGRPVEEQDLNGGEAGAECTRYEKWPIHNDDRVRPPNDLGDKVHVDQRHV